MRRLAAWSCAAALLLAGCADGSADARAVADAVADHLNGTGGFDLPATDVECRHDEGDRWSCDFDTRGGRHVCDVRVAGPDDDPAVDRISCRVEDDDAAA